MVPQGTSDIVRTFELPADAAEGDYAVEVAVRLLGDGAAGEGRSRASFSVAGVPPPQRDQPAAPPAPAPARMMRVTAASVELRAGPSPNSRAVARIPRDEAVEVLEDRRSGRDRWYRVRLVNGDEGWIPATAAAPNSR
jgi:Bacterial SH3 domain